jgi:hypothetical protein
MNSAIDKVIYYKELIRKNQQAWLKSKSDSDKKILRAQIKEFQKLQLRYSTIATKQILQQNQLQLFQQSQY